MWYLRETILNSSAAQVDAFGNREFKVGSTARWSTLPPDLHIELA
jgi:hypothetical protein